MVSCYHFIVHKEKEIITFSMWSKNYKHGYDIQEMYFKYWKLIFLCPKIQICQKYYQIKYIKFLGIYNFT